MSAPQTPYKPRLSIAPMMKYTDRHYRRVMRALTRHTLLYSEMVMAPAITKGARHDFLDHVPEEYPLALQLGGSVAVDLAEAAKIAEDRGWDEINLNVGCPSDRVQAGDFGACLMAEPERVAELITAMQAAVSIPVTVKHRIGIDHLDRYEDMLNFVDRVAATGCTRFTVHARKAWLQGLSPKENRNIPPLRYEDVYRLKQERPGLFIEINGGIKTLDEALAHLEHVDAVMIGRAAVKTPWIFHDADARIFNQPNITQHRAEAVLSLLPYLSEEISKGTRPHTVVRHLLGFFYAQPIARAWKHGIAEVSQQEGQDAVRALETLARNALEVAPRD